MGLIKEFTKLILVLLGIVMIGVLLLVFGPLLVIPAAFRAYTEKPPTIGRLVRIIPRLYILPIVGPVAATAWFTKLKPVTLLTNWLLMLVAVSYSTFIWFTLLVALRIIK